MTPISNGFLLSLSLCMDIGVVNVAMITLALQRGYWPGFKLGLGSCVGDLIYALLALAGMTTLLQFVAVRWVMWLGGGAVLLWLTVKMLRSALAHSGQALPVGGAEQDGSAQFWKGVLLALSSPSAIVWFAAVGGALIARTGSAGWQGTGLFLTGFFCAGLLWSALLCALAYKGGQWIGEKLLKYCYIASALLFAYFAWQVIGDGYRTLILQA
jgi:L-lysine exporter family protein LysE/ArgO